MKDLKEAIIALLSGFVFMLLVVMYLLIFAPGWK